MYIFQEHLGGVVVGGLYLREQKSNLTRRQENKWNLQVCDLGQNTTKMNIVPSFLCSGSYYEDLKENSRATINHTAGLSYPRVWSVLPLHSKTTANLTMSNTYVLDTVEKIPFSV